MANRKEIPRYTCMEQPEKPTRMIIQVISRRPLHIIQGTGKLVAQTRLRRLNAFTGGDSVGRGSEILSVQEPRTTRNRLDSDNIEVAKGIDEKKYHQRPLNRPRRRDMRDRGGISIGCRRSWQNRRLSPLP